MPTPHPTVVEISSFLRHGSGNPAASNARCTRHLLAGCPDCLRLLCDVRALKPSERGYGRAFAAAERALAAFLAQGCPPVLPPESLLSELASLPPGEQGRRVAGDLRFANLPLVHRLLEDSQALRYDDPGRMLHLAELARRAAEACPVETAGSEPRLADLRAQSWRQWANALRVCGRLHEAEEAFAVAQRFQRQGTGDPKLRALLCEQIASLCIFQRHFPAALDLAEEAGRIYRELEERTSLASTMVQRAVASLYSGEADLAVRLLNRALPLIDPAADPHLLLAACHNLVRCYIDLGQADRALSIHSEVRELYRSIEDPLIALRAGWQEGQLLRDLGHLRAAEAALRQARQGFQERDLLYEVAVISLELAGVYVCLDAPEDLDRTLAETAAIFRALEVGRDFLVSLLQLRRLADQKQRALDLIRFLASRLDRLPGCKGPPG